MEEKDKYSETDRFVCYKHTSGGTVLSMVFDREIKAVNIKLMTFHRNDEPTLELRGDGVYSVIYGHWQMKVTCLGLDDIEFLHQKSRELFGQVC